MKRMLIITAVLIFACGSLLVQTKSAESDSFHKAVAESPAPGTIFLYPERIRLKDGGFFAAERGMMFVPANRSDKKSTVIGIEVYRFKASGKAKPGTPPIFFLHGGPSFSGLERSLERLGTFEERWLPLLDVSDVVVVGQRGIGSSKPNTIIDINTNFPLDRAVTEEEAAAALREACAKEKAFWEAQGVDLSGLTVIEAAADVNDVRKALGYEKVIIWGGSFGSHWGMAFMRYYPDIVERAILRGMEGPNHTYDHPGYLWNVYKNVAAEAEKAPELQGLIPEGGLIRAIKTVVERIKKKPVKVTVTDPKTSKSQEVLFTTWEAGRLARGYSCGLPGWPANVIALYNGNFSEAAEGAVRRQGSIRFSTASFYMLDHASGITPEREAELKGDPAVRILGDINSHYTITRDIWGSDLGDEFRQNFETNIPTVIVHGTWDTSTPYENALELVPYFKNSKFIPVIRGPHGAIRAAMRASEKFRRGVMHFAATGDMSELPDKVEMPPVDWVIPESAKKKENKEG
jgi:pimeloyl-ACP methyl ester carboxylesterase